MTHKLWLITYESWNINMEPWKGYNTNAGAYYYYNREGDLNYDETMAFAARTFEENNIPIAWMQYDSWFYAKGKGSENGTDINHNSIFLSEFRNERINYPNRINLPSPRPQWSLFSLSIIHIFATRSAMRADLFYWDGLYLK